MARVAGGWWTAVSLIGFAALWYAAVYERAG
jgi:hypothetical protein